MIAGVTRRISSPVFVGRRAELERLDAAFDHAARGDPSVVLVAGEAGVGKSRLIVEFIARVEAGGGRGLTGGCLDLGGGGPPYAPFAEALRTFVRRLDPDARAAAFGPSTGALVRLVPDLRLAMADVGPQSVDAEPSGVQAQVFDAVIGALEHISCEPPLALIIEDIHWADGSTRDLVRFLVRNMATQRLALVMTYRSDELHRRHPLLPLLAELERSGRVERLDLAPFDRDELADQLVGILGEPASDEVVDTLLERSNGLPFYVEELIAGRDENGSALPATLRDVLALRLAALSDASLAVVRAAAVFGGPIPHEQLVAVTEMDDRALLAAVGEAVDAKILMPTEDPEGQSYTFRHALLREAASDELLPAERVRFHLRLADHLDAILDALPAVDASFASDAAVHAHLAHDLPRAFSSAVRAVHALVAATAYREALGHAERALELWPRVDNAEQRAGMDHPALLALSSQIAAATNQPARAVTLAREALAALEAAGDVDRRAALLADLYMLEWEVRDFQASAASIRRALELLEDREPSRLKAFVLWTAGWERWWEDRLAEAIERLEAAQQVAEAIGDRSTWADATGVLAHTVADLGYATRAGELADRSSSGVTDFEGRPISVMTVADRSIALWTAGRFDDSVTAGMIALEQARRYGWEARLGGDLRANVADALIETGRYDDAEIVLAPALAGVGSWTAQPWARQTMARIAILRGRFDDAHRYLDGLVPVGAVAGTGFFHAHVHVDLARAEGRFDSVIAAVEKGLDRLARSESVAGLWGLLGSAIGACADWAERARVRRRPDEAVKAEEHAERWIAILRSIVERGRAGGGAGPFIETTLATAEAEMGRIRGASDPEAWTSVLAGWRALGHPNQSAYAGLDSRARSWRAVATGRPPRRHCETRTSPHRNRCGRHYARDGRALGSRSARPRKARRGCDRNRPSLLTRRHRHCSRPAK